MLSVDAANDTVEAPSNQIASDITETINLIHTDSSARPRVSSRQQSYTVLGSSKGRNKIIRSKETMIRPSKQHTIVKSSTLPDNSDFIDGGTAR